jgi:tyrosyl-tRNA synthetase
MYGKVMSVKDELMETYFITTTRVPLPEVEALKKGHPRDMKMRLARAIVSLYHSDEAAQEAEKNFVHTFQKGETPSDIVEVSVKGGKLLVDVLLGHDIVSSKTEFRRLISAGAITHADTGEKVTDHSVKVGNATLKVGKRRFIKITVLK